MLFICPKTNTPPHTMIKKNTTTHPPTTKSHLGGFHKNFCLCTTIFVFVFFGLFFPPPSCLVFKVFFFFPSPKPRANPFFSPPRLISLLLFFTLFFGWVHRESDFVCFFVQTTTNRVQIQDLFFFHFPFLYSNKPT